jgi:hypothetical protein
MRFVYAIAREKERIARETRLIADLDLMQETISVKHPTAQQPFSASTYAMWELIERCACLAEKRRHFATMAEADYIWRRDGTEVV